MPCRPSSLAIVSRRNGTPSGTSATLMNLWARVCTRTGFVLALIVATAAAGAATPSQVSFSQQILNAHNKYREAVGVPPLAWSDELAAAAREWANVLSSNLEFAHDRELQNQGENLWMGTAGAFSLTQMVDAWGHEGQDFHNGTFPNVSTTGRQYDGELV
jgi:hypothetical protein